MKTILLLAAALGMTVSVAAAECAGHAKVTTAVDTETTVASVVKKSTPAGDAVTATKEEAVEAE